LDQTAGITARRNTPPPETPVVVEKINPDPELREQRMNMLNSASKKLKGLT
jgi:hypothetical protein